LEALRSQHELDKEYKEWEHRESEYQRSYHEVHRGKDQGGENRTGYLASTEVGRGDRWCSKSSGSAAPEMNSRQSDRRSANHRRDSSRPGYNMHQHGKSLTELDSSDKINKGEIGMMGIR